ncbi:MAG: threonylcarbamoyl-AMP synthase, partial [Deltaproteobacteria bacterium]|nr:threonylcarbamoyl-AMP synthase [Deltaproteobacteria bacterium]
FPHPRHIQRAVTILQAGGLIAYPTDTYYAIGCDMASRAAVEALTELKHRDSKKPFAVLCSDLAEAAKYALIGNEQYRLMRRLVPGPYTFILDGTRDVARTVINKRRQVGIRIPDAPIALALVRGLGRPLATTSAQLPDGEICLDAQEVQDRIGHGVELILDGGATLVEASTVLDLTGPQAVVLREGKGPVEGLL